MDKGHCGQGVARAALQGGLAQIGETTTGREAQGRFPFSGTVELSGKLGSSPARQVGKHAWVVNRVV